MSEMPPHHNPFAEPRVAAQYDAWFDTPLGDTVDRLEKALVARLARPRAGEGALDVGTGTGHWAKWLADMGLDVTGYDSAEAMLQIARADKRITWRQGDAARLPFGDGSFPLVLCVTALEFVAQPQEAVREMSRVVAPDGRLVVGVLNSESPFGQAYLAQARQEDSPFRHARLFTADSLLALLEPLGRVRWGGTVFFGPTIKHLALANCYERLGRLCPWMRERGALLVGRVDK